MNFCSLNYFDTYNKIFLIEKCIYCNNSIIITIKLKLI